MKFRDYLIDHTGFDWPSLLEEWHWLLPPEYSVWLLTCAGDLFIDLPDGSVHLLEVGSGELSRVADSREAAQARFGVSRVAYEWLMIPVVDQLVASGRLLGPGQCYSYKMLPMLGGSYAPEGRAVIPIWEHFSAWGLLHRQTADLPEGSNVKIEVTD